MGLISGILGNTPIATSAMKGSKYAEEHPDDPAGGYGGPGIVGTILKMYLGGAVGGAMGGAAGGGASGMAGAANGISGVTSGLGSSGGGLGGMLGGGSGGGLGGIMSGSGGGSIMDMFSGGTSAGTSGGISGNLMNGLSDLNVGDMAQNMIKDSSGGGGGHGSGQSGRARDNSTPQPNTLEDMMSRMNSMGGNARKNETGLMNIPGIPDYFKNQMSGW